ncbi:G2-specific serine/threonine protein kinase [Lecanora helva]
MPQLISEYENFTKIKLLKQGVQAVNWLCRRERDHRLFVRKTYTRYFKNDEGFPLEVEILKRVSRHHPKILSLECFKIRHNSNLELYFPYCEGGDLVEAMKHHGWAHKEEFLWHVSISVADALAFLHYGFDRKRQDPRKPPSKWQLVIHRDVKTDNIFLLEPYRSSQPLPRIVLGDFGAATLQSHSTDMGRPLGWVQPEFPRFTAKSDVWGLGAVVHHVCHGDTPTDPAPDGWDEEEWSFSPISKNPKALGSRYSDELNFNMMDCLETSSRERVDSISLVRHLVRDREAALRNISRT